MTESNAYRRAFESLKERRFSIAVEAGGFKPPLLGLRSTVELDRLASLFDENFTRFGELGAAVSVWQNGKSVLELQGGFRDAKREMPWTADTIVLFWSATKGLGSACLLHVLQERAIELTRRVAEFWPEFAQAGKSEITLAQLLSHQAGLCAFDEAVDVTDYPAVIAALEKQAPLWPPGTAHGYHARTFGFLLDELVRRIAGITLSEYWRTTFADPLDLDIWIGLPDSEQERVATIYPAKAGGVASPAEFYRDLATPGTHGAKSFHLSARTALRERHEQQRKPRVAVCFIWRNRQRDIAGKVLRDAGEWRRTRRPSLFSHPKRSRK